MVDSTVSGVWVSFHVIKVIFKSIKEFTEDLIFSLFTGFNIWMLFGIVGSSDIIDVE